MTEQETYDRTLDAPMTEEPLTLPNEEYYRQPAPRQVGGAARLGTLLVLIGLIWLAVELIGYGFGSGQSSARIPAPLPNNHIQLYLGSGDVEIVPGDGSEVIIEATQYGLWLGDPLVVSESAETVQVTNESRPRFGLCIGRCGVYYHVTLPRNADVTAMMSSGDVDLTGAEGAISIETSSGDVEAHDIANGLTVRSSSGDVTLDHVGGQLDVQTSSGDVQLEEGQVDNAIVQTNSGDVKLEGVAGSLTLHSNSGDITVREAQDGLLDIQNSSGDVDYSGSLASDGSFSVTASSGDVTLHLPETSDFTLEASTSSGDLRNDFQLRGEQQEGNTRAGTVGAGGPLLQVSTSSGDITIERQ
jgi:DUF4097 and DUF4098 domain-containing protein YvlB